MEAEELRWSWKGGRGARLTSPTARHRSSQRSCFRRYWNSQTGSDSSRCLHLFQPVAEIHVSDIVLRRVDVWIVLVIVTFDLQCGCYSLLTEGDLITSATADNERGDQVKLIGPDCFAHHLSQGQRWRMTSVPELHHPIAVAVVADHVNVYDIPD